MYLGNEFEDRKNKHGQPIGYHGDGHILTIGPTRSGKSRRLLIPNLLYETRRSAIVIDIKGELAAHTAAHRGAEGGKVVALDPFGELVRRGINVPRVGFNPMLRLDKDNDNFVDDAMGLAESLVQVSPEMKEPHWAESAQDFVAGLIMLVRCVYGENATLGMVRREISRSAPEIEMVARKALKSPPHVAIANKLSKFTDTKDNKELAGIMSTAQTQTRFLDSPNIAKNLAAGAIDFGLLKEQTITIYLVLPPERLVTHAKWLRLVIGSAMTDMQRTIETQKRPAVLFMLDEFPQLGRLQAIETAVSLNAGFGVKVWAAVQHLGQLKGQYGDNWETFLSAGCVTAFAPRDVFTRDHLTKLIGTGWKPMVSTSYNTGGGGGVTSSLQKDDLMPPNAWRDMILGEHFAFIPKPEGQLIERLYSPDFEELSELKANSGYATPA